MESIVNGVEYPEQRLDEFVEFSVESQIAKGTTVTIRLPIN